MVSSAVLTLAWTISRARSSRTDIILKACPGIRDETVFKSKCEPQNLTSTSATEDFEFATSSLMLSLMEDAEEVGDGSDER
jgi:hypothetical protein